MSRCKGKLGQTLWLQKVSNTFNIFLINDFPDHPPPTLSTVRKKNYYEKIDLVLLKGFSNNVPLWGNKVKSYQSLKRAKQIMQYFFPNPIKTDKKKVHSRHLGNWRNNREKVKKIHIIANNFSHEILFNIKNCHFPVSS